MGWYFEQDSFLKIKLFYHSGFGNEGNINLKLDNFLEQVFTKRVFFC